MAENPLRSTAASLNTSCQVLIRNYTSSIEEYLIERLERAHSLKCKTNPAHFSNH